MSRKRKKTKYLTGQNAAVVGDGVGSRTRFWMAVSIVAIGFFLYRPTLHAPFILDDVRKIISNPDIRVDRLSDVFSKLVYPYSENKTFDRNDPSRPVTYLTFTLNYYFGQLDPYGYRVVNLLGHVGVGILLFLLSRRLFFLLFGAEQTILSFLTALLFVVHPVNAVVALYPFNRSDILASLTLLGSVLLFLDSGRNRRWKYGGAVALFVVGLGSKQSVAVLPAILLLTDFVVVHRGHWDSFRAHARAHIPFWIVLAVYFIWRGAYFGSLGDLEAESPIDRWPYAVSQIHSVTQYLRFFFVPKGLSIDHMSEPYASLTEPAILRSAGVLLLLLGAAWAAVRKGTPASKLVLFSVLWFVLQLAPTSSFLPTTTALAENRLYLSQYGLLLLLLLGYCWVFRVDLAGPLNARSKIVFLGVLVCHLSVLGGLAYRRGLLFSDPIQLWEDVIRLYPQQSRALYNLGFIYSERKQYDKSLSYYLRAIECNPRYAEALNNIGTLYARRWDTEKAIEYFRKSVEATPRERPYCNLARSYTTLKKFPEAMAALDSALVINPSSYIAYTLKGRLWFEQNNHSLALQNYDQAARLSPDFVELQNNLGLLNLAEKKFGPAAGHFERAIASDPNFAEAYYNVSLAYSELGRAGPSQESFEKACSLDPQYIFKPPRTGVEGISGGAFQLPPNIEKYLHASPQ